MRNPFFRILVVLLVLGIASESRPRPDRPRDASRLDRLLRARHQSRLGRHRFQTGCARRTVEQADHSALTALGEGAHGGDRRHRRRHRPSLLARRHLSLPEHGRPVHLAAGARPNRYGVSESSTRLVCGEFISTARIRRTRSELGTATPSAIGTAARCWSIRSVLMISRGYLAAWSRILKKLT